MDLFGRGPRESTASSIMVSVEITNLAHNYFELKKMTVVSIAGLRRMLQTGELLWEWPQSDENEGNTYTLEDLHNSVQMSELELSTALNNMPVVEHNGKIRWLSYDLRDRLLDFIVEAIDDDGMPNVTLNHLTANILRSFLPENVTDTIIEWFLRAMCKKTEDGDYDVDPDALSSARASQLLRTAPRFEIGDFYNRVDALMPLGISLNPSSLLGISIQYGNVRASYISYMSIDELPDDTRDRLASLFLKKKQWKFEEIAPFLSDICTDSKQVGLLLMNMCNSIQLNDGTRVYCSIRRI
ncbi:hypothetical protein DICVIV_02157 [Dictyocaulus viviparus]|uniref:Sister chromatid cohesion protein DCC1 n=1 Tax=Dictyocaulus viviparus TaxID=29172 RepID=A0A0D8YAJ9_DICVI|nr:hypothetical protein DICVIV_02157 [Dictyocaulus viviparus]